MKRYLITLQAYIYAENDVKAVQEALLKVKELDTEDNYTRISSIAELPFGSLKTRKVKI